MKNFGKLFLMLLIASIFCVSCEKEGQYRPLKKILKQTIVVTQDGESQRVRYEYAWDGANLSNVVSYVDEMEDGSFVPAEYSESITQYTYDSKNRVASIEYQGSQSTFLKYIYDGNELEEIECYTDYTATELYSTFEISHSGKHIDKIEVELADNDDDDYMDKAAVVAALFFLPEEVASVIAENQARHSSLKGQKVATYVFTWDGDNVSKFVADNGSLKKTYTYTYDSNKNPFYGWFDRLTNTNWQLAISKNNVLTVNGMQETGEAYSEMEPITYTYEYSGKYPVSRKYVRTSDNYSITYTYEY